MKIKIRIDNRVRLRTCDLPFDVLAEIKKEYTYDNPAKMSKRAMGIPDWDEPWHFAMWRTEGKDFTLPRGTLRGVREILESHGLAFKIKDLRTTGGVCINPLEYIGPEPRYYQVAAMEQILKKQNCYARMPTASGKSLMAMMLISKIGLNTLVILPTVGLFKQWSQDALEGLKIAKKDLGIIRGKKRVLRPLTIAVQATLASRDVDEEINEYFGVIIIDEVQKCAARTYVDVVDPFTAKYRIGISADERRKDNKQFLTTGLFGSCAYEIKRKALEQEGYIMDVEVRVVPTNFRADWYGIPDPNVPIWNRKKIDFPALLEQMTNDKERNELIYKHALKEIQSGEQCIVLSARREHCLDIDRTFVTHGIRTGFLIGGLDYQVEYEKTRVGIQNRTVSVGVGTYGALGVGVNLPSVSVGFAVTPVAGNKFQTNQVRGRLARLGKDKSRPKLYIFWDRHIYPGHIKDIIAQNPTVTVFDKGKWVEGRQWVKSQRGRGRSEKI